MRVTPSQCIHVLHDRFSNAGVGFVMTFSRGSRGGTAQFRGRNFRGMEELASEYAGATDAHLLVDARGASCGSLPPVLSNWLQRGRGACMSGPNRGAREAHTILQFCVDFYDSLPRVVVFVQDDPEVHFLKKAGVGSTALAATLEARTEERRRLLVGGKAGGVDGGGEDGGGVDGGGGIGAIGDGRIGGIGGSSGTADTTAAGGGNDVLNEGFGASAPWEVSPCPCFVDHESTFSMEKYGVFRPMHWWMRTFLKAYTNRSVPLPPRIAWPRHAQFAVPRTAVRARSKAWFELNAALTRPASPLKVQVPVPANGNRRAAIWANFGRWVVDLGPLPPERMNCPDHRRAAHGMDLAMMYERLWFRIFDPALAEALPSHSQCFTDAAIALSPIRCGAISCPVLHAAAEHRNRPFWGRHKRRRQQQDGCALTDALGTTVAEGEWRFVPGRPVCMASGCMVDENSEAALGTELYRERGAAGNRSLST